MFNILLDLLSNEHIDKSTKIPIVDNLFGFLHDLDHLKLAQGWLTAGIVYKEEESKTELFKLGQRHKYSILKKIFEEPSISIEVKNSLLASTIGEDKSDIAENTKETCHALLPSPEGKA